jgi:hypothetical protein
MVALKGEERQMGTESQAGYQSARPSRGEWGALLAIVFLGLLLRVWGIGSFPLEQDELYTRIESRMLWDSPFVPGIDARPLYFLLQHGLMAWLPASPEMLRLPSLVFGVAGLAVMCAIGWVTGGTRRALILGLLTAIHPWHMYVSGMARYWSAAFLFMGMVLLGLAAGARHQSRGWYLVAVAGAVLGVLSHPSFLFPLGGLLAGRVLFRVMRAEDRISRLEWRTVMVPVAAGVGAWLGWLFLVGDGSAVKNFGGRGLESSLRLIPAVVVWATPAVFAAGVLGAVAGVGWGEKTDRREGVALLVGVIGCLTLLAAVSVRTSAYADYAVSALPLLLAGAAVLLDRLAATSYLPGRFAAPAVVLLVAVPVLPSTVSHLSDGSRFDYRPALRYLEKEAPAELALVWPIIVQREYAPALRSAELRPRRAYLDSLLTAERQFSVIISMQRARIVGGGAGPEAGAWLVSHCRAAFVDAPPRLDFRLYRVEVRRCTE